MRRSFKFILTIIVSFECFGLALLSYLLYLRLTSGVNVLGIKVIPVRKEYLIGSPSAELKYFFEPQVNSIQVDQPDWSKDPVIYTNNADTLNDRYNYSVEKSPGVFRVFALGDSFTFGQYVNTADAWPEKLEDMLNNGLCRGSRFEVITLGVQAYDVQYISRRFQLRGLKYESDLIIWLESSSGFKRLSEIDTPNLQKLRTKTLLSGNRKCGKNRCLVFSMG